MSEKIEKTEKTLWDFYGAIQKEKPIELGPYTSYRFLNSPRQLLFSIARYKFAAKLFGSKQRILELGGGDGLGAYYLSEFEHEVSCVDFDGTSIGWAKENPVLSHIHFIEDNFLGQSYGVFDGVVSFDVLEHIYPRNEGLFMHTIKKNLSEHGVLILGTPSLESQQYAGKDIGGAHVNLYTGEGLRELLSEHFHHVFLFTQNDEIIHTGFFPMANYLIALCCGKKESTDGGIHEPSP